MRSIRKTASATIVLLVVGILLAPLFGGAAQRQRLDFAAIFDKHEVMIPMRDGVKLHTEFYTPKNASGPLPILMNRTPYGISSPDKGFTSMLFRYSDMVPDGYIFAFQD